MEILGQGHKGVVVADGADAVKKFYVSETEWDEERTRLTFLSEMQAGGFNIGCTIPKLLNVIGRGSWEVGGRTYNYCNQMERIAGTSANKVASDFTQKEVAATGTDLGSIAFAMHSLAKTYIGQWRRTFGDKYELLDHILNDKAGQVLREEPDPSVKTAVQVAASYLENKRELLAKEATLSHLDFTLSNTQVATDGHVYGLVDWGSFGLTSPSLSLYQLAPRPVWPYVRQEYERQGGVINEDIVFAAAAVHLAWAPVICKQLGLPIDKDETRENFDIMYANFQTASTK